MQKLYSPLLMLAILGCFCCKMTLAEASAGTNKAGGQHQNTLLLDIDTENSNTNDDSDNYNTRVARYLQGVRPYPIDGDQVQYENPKDDVKKPPAPINSDKRVERYAFGLGRRAYTYSAGGNGIKRLPVYNFGLGKRARPYSFGLGKRAEYDDDQYGDGDYERSYMDEKRNRPYSFGLGKRGDLVEDMERRGYPNRYGFGLGRR